MFTSARIPAAAAMAVVGLLLSGSSPAAAQEEGALRSFFEGKAVVLRIDMPGTSDGVNIRPDARQSLDSDEYRDDLKKHGTAIRAGDQATVTVVKVKKDHIEFQLDGGGFGTFGDDTSTSVYIPLIEKSSREKDLEKRIDQEEDRRRRREMERELDELRERRERQNRRIMAERAEAEERKRERVAADRLRGGSRFNLRYDGSVPTGMRPEDVMTALAEYVDFGALDPRFHPATAGPAGDTIPRKGMLRSDAERTFGPPLTVTDRREGALRVTTAVFAANGERITADFVEDVLVRYTIASE